MLGLPASGGLCSVHCGPSIKAAGRAYQASSEASKVQRGCCQARACVRASHLLCLPQLQRWPLLDSWLPTDEMLPFPGLLRAHWVLPGRLLACRVCLAVAAALGVCRGVPAASGGEESWKRLKPSLGGCLWAQGLARRPLPSSHLQLGAVESPGFLWSEASLRGHVWSGGWLEPPWAGAEQQQLGQPSAWLLP